MIVAYRLDACMFGVLAAWLKHFHPESWQRRPHFVFAAGLFILGIVVSLPFVLPGESLFPHTIGFTLTSFGALLLLPLLDRWTSAHGIGATAVVKMSIWSYSLYLVNLPVHTLIQHSFPRVSPFLLAPMFLFFSIAIAALIYRFYEKPIMMLRQFVAVPRPGFGLDGTSPVMAKN